jgi:hypothetical protein
MGLNSLVPIQAGKKRQTERTISSIGKSDTPEECILLRHPKREWLIT